MGDIKESRKYLVGICAYNEGAKLARVVMKFNDYKLYDVLLVDDGSDDNSFEKLPAGAEYSVIRNERKKGAGFGTRQVIDYAFEQGYFGVIFVSGNDKDRPEDIHKFIEGFEQGYDLIQGSRYLPGGVHDGIPAYRVVATRYIHPILFSLIVGRKITDSTNGFRAMRTEMARDKNLDLTQDWLDQYELEPYLFYKAIKLGYRVTEVPVQKIYPPKSEGYTKMRPVWGWWSILRPLVYLALGIKK